jgi:hypothetical protein
LSIFFCPVGHLVYRISDGKGLNTEVVDFVTNEVKPDIPPTPESQQQNDAVDESQKDSVERLERVIDIQVETASSIDEKSQYIIRITAIIFGVLIAAVQLSDDVFGVDPTEATFPFYITLLGGGILLLFAIFWSALSYSGSNLYTGISPRTGTFVANNEVRYGQHMEEILVLYANMAEANEETIRTDSMLMTRGLACLLAGLVFLGFGAAPLIFDSSPLFEWIVVGLVAIISLSSGYLILNKEEFYDVDQGPRFR